MTPSPAIELEQLRHQYGARTALDGISLSVRTGEIFGILGPNGGGKTTLFRILSTLLQPSAGQVRVFGLSLLKQREAVRKRLGVVFQHPSLDPQLTVMENLIHQGHLYGLSGAGLRRRAGEMLNEMGVADRAGERVHTLSGGLQRRVELAKGLLHRPDLLLLDEPSTGLDPGARRDFSALLRRLCDRGGVTIALTTHFMEEAERCDRVAVLDQGRIEALGTPDELKAHIPGDVVVVESNDLASLAEKIRARFGVEPTRMDGSLRFERARGHELVREIAETFPGEVLSASFARPTLEDVFLHFTGHRFWSPAAEDAASGENN
ncbi:MAG: ABC transporter ATP-binding protein [Acidobacteriota bacterium]